MKRLLLITLSLIACGAPAFAWNPFEGLIKAKVADEVAAVSNKLYGETTGIKGDLSVFKGRLDKLAEINAKLTLQVEQQNKVIGVVSGNVQDIKARDITYHNQVNNDTGLMWKIIYGLLTVIGTLLGIVRWVIKQLFKEMSNARFYQIQLAAETDAQKLDEIMKKKKEIDGQKKLLQKAINAAKSFKGVVKKEAV